MLLICSWKISYNKHKFSNSYILEMEMTTIKSVLPFLHFLERKNQVSEKLKFK